MTQYFEWRYDEKERLFICDPIGRSRVTTVENSWSATEANPTTLVECDPTASWNHALEYDITSTVVYDIPTTERHDFPSTCDYAVEYDTMSTVAYGYPPPVPEDLPYTAPTSTSWNCAVEYDTTSTVLYDNQTTVPPDSSPPAPIRRRRRRQTKRSTTVASAPPATVSYDSPPTESLRRTKRPYPPPSIPENTPCQVCGDQGPIKFNFGAFVCNPCKSFFHHFPKWGLSEKCKHKENCEITPKTRRLCVFCRHKKCTDIGMNLIENPVKSAPKFTKPCEVCGLPSKLFSYNAVVCSPCKNFYSQALYRSTAYTCNNNGECLVEGPAPCGACRWKKCVAIGMKGPDLKRSKKRKSHEDSEGSGESGSPLVDNENTVGHQDSTVEQGEGSEEMEDESSEEPYTLLEL